MQISDGKIGTRELLSVVIFIVGMKVTDTTPDLLIPHALNATWLVSLFSCAFMAIPLFTLLKLIQKYNICFNDLLLRLTGFWVSRVILVWLLLGLFISVTIISRSYVDIVNTLFFPLTSIPAIYLMLIGFSCFTAIRGFETIGRMAWFLFWIIMIVAVVLVLTTRQNAEISHLFPIFGPGLGTLVWDGMVHSSIFSELLFLPFFFSYVTSFRSFQRGMWIGFGLSTLIFVMLTALYVMVFDFPAIRDIAYPYHQLTRAASFGNRAAHLESIFLGIWIISATVHFAIYLYILAYLFSRIFRIHEFEPLIFPIAGLVIMIGGFPNSIIQQNVARDLLISVSSIVFILLPFVLWGIHWWKGRST